MKPEQERVKQVIADSVTHMCRSGIPFQKEMRIEAVIGITIDTDDVLLVHINEKFDTKDIVNPKDFTTDPSFIIGDITQKVLSKVNKTPTKEPTPARGRSNGSAKAPAKRAPGKRGRKQKLVPMTNGEINEKVVTDTTVPEAVCLSSEVTESTMGVSRDRENYDINAVMIKSEPPDQIIQNGISDDGESVTTKETAKSDDDTLAMQQGYTDHANIEPASTLKEKSYTPPRKRQLLSTHTSDNQEQKITPSTETTGKHGKEDRGSSLSPSWPNVSTTTPMDDSITSPSEQKQTATTTWSSPTQTKSRSRRPSNGLQSTAVKRMLSEYLVEPIAQTDCKVCTFRLMWHGSVEESEQVWSQLPYYQEAIDRIITEPAQVALAVSAVTATSTRPKSGSGKLGPNDTPDKFRTFPGLAYWIVLQNEQDFTETDLYNRIYENSFGARLKSLSDQAVASDLQEMCSTLYLVVKDNVDGYVRWKLDAVLPSTDGEMNFQPVVKVYARAEQDFNTLLMAREALQKNRFYFSLLKTDV